LKERALYRKVPILYVDGVAIPQSKSIERFLAKKFGLSGKNDVEAAQIDAVVEQVTDIKQDYQASKNDDAKKNTFFEQKLPEYFALFEHQLEQNGGSYLVGSKVSLADLQIWAILSEVNGGYWDNKAGVRNALLGKTRLRALIEELDRNVNLLKWVRERPVTPN